MTARGTIVTVVLPGEYRKPRPGIVVQTALGNELPSLVVVPVTTDLRTDRPHFRVTIEPDSRNGLQKLSQAMVDKVMTVSRSKIGITVGSLDELSMGAVSSRLATLLGLV